MAVVTRSFRPLYSVREDVRAIFGSYIELHTDEERFLFFWRDFIVTGPAEVLEKAAAEYEANEGAEFWNWHGASSEKRTVTRHRFTCSKTDAKHLRAFLGACGARFSEGRHWTRRKFTVTSADDAVLQGVREIQDELRIAHSYSVPQAQAETERPPRFSRSQPTQ